jgi:hypothetical protein
MRNKIAATLAALTIAVLTVLVPAPAHAAVNNVNYYKYDNSTWGTLLVTCRGGATWAIGAPNQTRNYCWDTGWIRTGNPASVDLHCYVPMYGRWMNLGDQSVSVKDWGVYACATVWG